MWWLIIINASNLNIWCELLVSKRWLRSEVYSGPVNFGKFLSVFLLLTYVCTAKATFSKLLCWIKCAYLPLYDLKYESVFSCVSICNTCEISVLIMKRGLKI